LQHTKQVSFTRLLMGGQRAHWSNSDFVHGTLPRLLLLLPPPPGPIPPTPARVLDGTAAAANEDDADEEEEEAEDDADDGEDGGESPPTARADLPAPPSPARRTFLLRRGTIGAAMLPLLADASVSAAGAAPDMAIYGVRSQQGQ
jgi:hypothetical protein